jgi:hypothetical protein
MCYYALLYCFDLSCTGLSLVYTTLGCISHYITVLLFDMREYSRLYYAMLLYAAVIVS